MKHRMWRVALIPLVALVLGLALAAALSAGAPRSVVAQGGTGVVRVAKTGSDAPDCGSAAIPCATIQYAVAQAAEGDEVRVATQETVVASLSGPFTTTQVALITKSLTLRGGYTTADWSMSVPTQNVTIVDAEGYGRAISIVGNGTQSVTVEGFTITGGDYTGLGNSYSDGQCGRGDGDCGAACTATTRRW